MKAIIIDDEPDCVRLMALQLKMYCPQVEVVAECTGSEEGLKVIRNHAVDVVFLDIQMPGESGFQLLERLPGTGELARAHVVPGGVVQECVGQALLILRDDLVGV